VDYSITDKAPYTFTAVYADGSQLVIPMDKMFSQTLLGSTLTLFRRHKKTGRLVPFQVSFDTLKALTPAATAVGLKIEDIPKLVPARFDPKLTPWIDYYLEQAQLMYAMMGISNVLLLMAGSGVPARTPLGGGVGIASKSLAKRTAVRQAAAMIAGKSGGTKVVIATAGTSVVKVADELLAATASITHNGARFIKAAATLSAKSGLTVLEKVKVIQEFAKKIGFGFGKQGLLDEGAHLVLYSEDSFYAFRFIKDSGRISYGKFDKAKADYIWKLLE
jgi:hypothetical protein